MKYLLVSLALTISLLMSGPAAASAWLGRFEDAPSLTPENPPEIGAWQDIKIRAEEAGIDEKGDPVPLASGRLKYLGGIVLTSPYEKFGGFSAMRLSEDGETLLALSDRGRWLTATVSYRENGAIDGLDLAKMASMERHNGEELTGPAADAESLDISPDGYIITGFERYHRIDLYKEKEGRLRWSGRALPNRIVKGLPDNGSIESLALLPDDQLLTIAEENPEKGADFLNGWISAPKVWRNSTDDWQGFSYIREPEYNVTDMAIAPGGPAMLYVTERAFSRLKGVRVRITRLPLADLKPGATVYPEEIARLNAMHGIDNMEAMDLRRLPDGRLILYILSDDNFSLSQRTVLQSWEITG